MSAGTQRKQRTLAHRLRALRAERGLSQEELAEAAGISRDAVARLELGSRTARFSTLQRLQEALAIPMEQLVSDRAELLANEPERARLDGLLQHLSPEGLRLVLELTIAVHDHERRSRAPSPRPSRRRPS